jgi:hypothetical protein
MSRGDGSRLKRLRRMWEEFSEVPVDNDDRIEHSFYGFGKGTDRMEIWHWFDENSPHGLVKDLLLKRTKGGDMRKWFYVDITTICHERVAVKAEDEKSAKDIAGALVDAGTIDFSEASEFAYGSISDSITVAEREYKRPPTAMRKFDGLHVEVVD